jgi:hypothetical protein
MLDIVPPAVFLASSRPRSARSGVRDSKGSVAILPAMRTNRRLPADRDRALARLRRVTVGTAAGGVIGTMLFGALAAATYDGTTQTSTTADAAQVAANDDTTTATDTSSSSTAADDASTLQATQPPTSSTSSSGAHASTGGS